MADTRCTIEVHAQPAVVWAVLWDVERYPEFLSDTVDTVVRGATSADGEQRQEVDFRVQLIRPLRYTAELLGRPPTRIEWHATESADYLREHRGSWAVEPTPDGRSCALTYELAVSFELPIPDAVIRRFADLNLPTMLRQVKARAELLARRQEMAPV